MTGVAGARTATVGHSRIGVHPGPLRLRRRARSLRCKFPSTWRGLRGGSHTQAEELGAVPGGVSADPAVLVPPLTGRNCLPPRLLLPHWLAGSRLQDEHLDRKVWIEVVVAHEGDYLAVEYSLDHRDQLFAHHHLKVVADR